MHADAAGEVTPEERAECQPAVDGCLVQRQGARLDPVRDENLHRRVVGGDRGDPAAAADHQRGEQHPQRIDCAEDQHHQGEDRGGQADQPAAADPAPRAADQGAADDRADAEGAEHVAVHRGVAVRIAVRQQRQQRPHRAGGNAEEERTQHHQPGDAGVLGEAQRGNHPFEQMLRR
ncbi:hypothetical protein D3C81_1206040 [compost metagenome]